jgi:hypothetical protein
MGSITCSSSAIGLGVCQKYFGSIHNWKLGAVAGGGVKGLGFEA